MEAHFYFMHRLSSYFLQELDGRCLWGLTLHLAAGLSLPVSMTSPPQLWPLSMASTDPDPQPQISYMEICTLRGVSLHLCPCLCLSLCFSLPLCLSLSLFIFSVSLSVSVYLSLSLSLSFPPRVIHSSPKPNCTLAKAGGTVATPGYIMGKKWCFQNNF